jgi:hypothetical protein
VHDTPLENVPFLRSAEHGFLAQISLLLQPAIYPPSEYVPVGFLHLLMRGRAHYSGRLLVKGSWWGDDCFLSSARLRRDTHGRAISYIEVASVTGERLVHVAIDHGYGRAYAAIRRHTILLALRREVVRRAQEHRVAVRAQCATPAMGDAGAEPSILQGQCYMPGRQDLLKASAARRGSTRGRTGPKGAVASGSKAPLSAGGANGGAGVGLIDTAELGRKIGLALRRASGASSGRSSNSTPLGMRASASNPPASPSTAAALAAAGLSTDELTQILRKMSATISDQQAQINFLCEKLDVANQMAC